MGTTGQVDQVVDSSGNVAQSNAAHEPGSQSLWSQVTVSCLFWLLCLTLTAAGHRFYKATVTIDRKVSAAQYQSDGAPVVWTGYGNIEDARRRISQALPTVGQLHALPNSTFWLSAAICFSVLSAFMAWSGRWIDNNGIQSLLGLLAGHLLWLGAIEFGLDAAGRRLGLAGSLELVGDKVVGTHAAGTLIQLSVVFLVPMLIGLTMHESNRCAMFQWFRKRLPITRTAAASGRVENYASRTAIQYFMTVWFCYVGVLWLADPRMGRLGEVALLVTLVTIAAATPYMIWRTARQSGRAQALRYSVSGAVVTWTGIEIAAAMNFFEEPWLSSSLLSGGVLLGMSIVLTAMVARVLYIDGPRWRLAPSCASIVLLIVMVGMVGCNGEHKPKSLSAEQVIQELRNYEKRIQVPSSTAIDGLLHALGSGDPQMRAQAAVACGKMPRSSNIVKERLTMIALNDESRLCQFAAISALGQLKAISPELKKRLDEISSDQVWGPVAQSIAD